MEIDVVRKKKTELENSISKLIKDFKDETGVQELAVDYDEKKVVNVYGVIVVVMGEVNIVVKL